MFFTGVEASLTNVRSLVKTSRPQFLCLKNVQSCVVDSFCRTLAEVAIYSVVLNLVWCWVEIVSMVGRGRPFEQGLFSSVSCYRVRYKKNIRRCRLSLRV